MICSRFQDIIKILMEWRTTSFSYIRDPLVGPARLNRLFITRSTHASQVAFETRLLFLKPRAADAFEVESPEACKIETITN